MSIYWNKGTKSVQFHPEKVQEPKVQPARERLAIDVNGLTNKITSAPWVLEESGSRPGFPVGQGHGGQRGTHLGRSRVKLPDIHVKSRDNSGSFERRETKGQGRTRRDRTRTQIQVSNLTDCPFGLEHTKSYRRRSKDNASLANRLDRTGNTGPWRLEYGQKDQQTLTNGYTASSTSTMYSSRAMTTHDPSQHDHRFHSYKNHCKQQFPNLNKKTSNIRGNEESERSLRRPKISNQVRTEESGHQTDQCDIRNTQPADALSIYKKQRKQMYQLY